MQFVTALIWGLVAASSVFASQSTDGIYGLIKRRLPEHADSFELSLVNATGSTVASATDKPNDKYTVSSAHDGKILVEGNSLSALASGYVVQPWVSGTLT